MNEVTANRTYNIITNGNTYIPGHWLLEAIIVCTKGGTGHVAALFDSTESLGENSELARGSFDTVNTLGRIQLNIPMLNGIYVKTGGGTVANLLVVYRPL